MREKKSEKKRDYILAKAKHVFIRKGYASVTMKDIIDECGISRGGIYLYFHSVSEIFMQVIYAHNRQKLAETQRHIAEEKSFAQLIDEYFSKQKKRLLNMQNSLLVAMYEFRFAHKENYDKEFFTSQYLYTKSILMGLLEYGVKKGEIQDDSIDEMATNIMFFIEGISMLGTATGITEDIIDSQIAFIKKIIFATGRTQ